jgi:GcrA cell cycle regulator
MNQPIPSLLVAAAQPDGAVVTWTADRVVLLELHYAQGLSAAESARRLGGVSRNAVISKRYRLGLLGRIAPVHPLKPRGVGPAKIRLRRLAPADDLLDVAPLPPMDLPPPIDARPSILADRGPLACAWPLGPAELPGDATTLVCGAPRTIGRSYCAAHAERARRPMPDGAPDDRGATR